MRKFTEEQINQALNLAESNGLDAEVNNYLAGMSGNVPGWLRSYVLEVVITEEEKKQIESKEYQEYIRLRGKFLHFDTSSIEDQEVEIEDLEVDHGIINDLNSLLDSSLRSPVKEDEKVYPLGLLNPEGEEEDEDESPKRISQEELEELCCRLIKRIHGVS